MCKFLLLLTVSSTLLSLSWAPFPEDHALNFANPWIEPWWRQLTKAEQKVGQQRGRLLPNQ